ncbi:MAG TPA: hypothetical protein PLJ23_07640, partial [Gemmatimonadales bacterium]|nr:hypothetical protein [Gemmatimonadales bacterium]
MRSRHLVLAAAVAVLACGGSEPAPRVDAARWEDVVASARGTTVRWRMWRGDPSINAYVDEWVTSRLAERYGVRFDRVNGDET